MNANQMTDYIFDGLWWNGFGYYVSIVVIFVAITHFIYLEYLRKKQLTLFEVVLWLSIIIVSTFPLINFSIAILILIRYCVVGVINTFEFLSTVILLKKKEERNE